MKVEPLEVYSEATNNAVVRAPGRRFPGVVIQGDSLSSMLQTVADLRAAIERGSLEEAKEEADHLHETLRQRLLHYEQVLAAHGLPLPYARSASTDAAPPDSTEDDHERARSAQVTTPATGLPQRAVYILWHVHEFDDGHEEPKLIGVYATEDEANSARERVENAPGFRDLPQGFQLDRYEVGRDHWTEGYVTVRHGE